MTYSNSQVQLQQQELNDTLPYANAQSTSKPWYLWLLVALVIILVVVVIFAVRRRMKFKKQRRALEQQRIEELGQHRKDQDFRQRIREQQSYVDAIQNQTNINQPIKSQAQIQQQSQNQNQPPLLSYYVRPPQQQPILTQEQQTQETQNELRSEARFQMLLRQRMQYSQNEVQVQVQSNQYQNPSNQVPKQNNDILLRVDDFEEWKQINTSDKIDNNNNVENNKIVPYTETCSICLESLQIRISVIVPCQYQHSFHKDCIRAWLEMHDTCPHCRGPLKYRDIR